jgi:hypothetical protein
MIQSANYFSSSVSFLKKRKSAVKEQQTIRITQKKERGSPRINGFAELINE